MFTLVFFFLLSAVMLECIILQANQVNNKSIHPSLLRERDIGIQARESYKYIEG